jgi:hypothetical protein
MFSENKLKLILVFTFFHVQFHNFGCYEISLLCTLFGMNFCFSELLLLCCTQFPRRCGKLMKEIRKVGQISSAGLSTCVAKGLFGLFSIHIY